MRKLFVLFLLALSVTLVGLTAADDPLVGSWKLDVAKSKYAPGPPPQNASTKYDQTSQGLEVTADGVNAKGVHTTTHYTANYDGKDYPATGSQNYDSVSMKRINSNTTEVVRKKAGKAEATIRRVVSQDGKTLTLTVKGTNAQGQAIDEVLVYEKQ